MEWDRIEANWRQFKVSVKEQWAQLSEAQIDAIAGKREVLTLKIRESYGITPAEAEKQVGAWQARVK